MQLNAVEQLKKDLALKEEQMASLRAALADMRKLVAESAVQTAQKSAEEQRGETSVQKLIEKHTRDLSVSHEQRSDIMPIRCRNTF